MRGCHLKLFPIALPLGTFKDQNIILMPGRIDMIGAEMLLGMKMLSMINRDDR
jgi:hypothetical protein